MTPEAFRKLALALPDAIEGAHQGHADFRVGGKIFATLGPDETWAMLKLPSEIQESCCAEAPDTYEPFPGAWGKQGCTRLQLAFAKTPSVRAALRSARDHVAH